MQEDIETAFLEWQLDLKREFQENIAFDHFDRTLKMVFLRRTPSFNRDHLSSLKEKVKEIHPQLLVSTIQVKDF